jgi:hypothetical protein
MGETLGSANCRSSADRARPAVFGNWIIQLGLYSVDDDQTILFRIQLQPVDLFPQGYYSIEERC